MRVPMNTSASPTRSSEKSGTHSDPRERIAGFLCLIAARITSPWFVLGHALSTTGLHDDEQTMHGIYEFADKRYRDHH